MKKALKVLSFIVLLPLAVALPVFLAQTINEDAKVYAQAGNLQERVEKYKAGLSEQPSSSELDRLKLRCSVAQTALKNTQTRVATVQEKRVNAYAGVNEAVTELIAALDSANIDATDLKTQTAVLKEKTDAFATELVAYKQAVDDSAELDCATDPLALRAAIQEGRNRLTTLISSATDITQHVNNLLKPSLQKIKADLQVQQNAAEVPPVTEGATDAAQ